MKQWNHHSENIYPLPASFLLLSKAQLLLYFKTLFFFRFCCAFLIDNAMMKVAFVTGISSTQKFFLDWRRIHWILIISAHLKCQNSFIDQNDWIQWTLLYFYNQWMNHTEWTLLICWEVHYNSYWFLRIE